MRLERAMQKSNTTHATDLTEQGAEVMCVPVTSMVHLDLERGSFTYCFMPIVILASPAWCRAQYSTDCCYDFFLILLHICFSCCILHSCREEVLFCNISAIFHNNWAQHRLLKEVIRPCWYWWACNQSFLCTQGGVRKGRADQVTMALTLHPPQKNP